MFKRIFRDIKRRKLFYIELISLLVVLIIILGFKLFSNSEKKISDATAILQDSTAVMLENDTLNQGNTNLNEYGIPAGIYTRKDGIVKRGDLFSTLLNNLGISQRDIYNLTQNTKDVFDVKLFKVGYPYHCFYSKDEGKELKYFVYDQDAHSFAVFDLSNLTAKTVEKQIDTTRIYSEVVINSSLWYDTQKAGATPLLTIKLSDIYAWTIDFFGIQKGDSFKALYEVLSYKDDTLDVGKVLYAEFTHAGESFPVYYFKEGEKGNLYWNEKGESMRKAFLKAPLSYTRISSRFSYHRRHPITHIVKAHTGIDYAAPTGTHVFSVADGVVTYAGWLGGGGNTIKITHNSVYRTAYMHLSRYAKGIRSGVRVKQGQLIGYVGMTGMATGPHLDYRIWKNGTPINPLKMVSPPTTPIAESDMPAFETVKNNVSSQIASIKSKDVLIQMAELIK
ncbi:MAG: peptidoglycan DD-metalloendopeptidase family protein [Bacteroidales bacterium]